MFEQKNCIGVDWISFTSFLSRSTVLDFLGLHNNDLFDLQSGRNGYNNCYKIKDFNAFFMFHTDRPEMGIHVDISGSAVDTFFSDWVNRQPKTADTPFGTVDCEYTVIDYVLAIREIAHFTRLDICLDDFEYNGVKPTYTPRELFDLHLAGRIVSKYRTFRFVQENGTFEYSGSTFYCGSRLSGNMLRVYDKKCEQNKKRKALGQDLLTDEWVRWELELRDERANNFVDALNNEYNSGGAFNHLTSDIFCKHFQRVLNGLMRIIDLDDSNRSRCSTNAKWQSFVNTVLTVSISVKVVESTLSKKLGWVTHSVVPTLIALFVGHGYSFDWLFRNVTHNYERLSDRMKNSLRQIDGNCLSTLQLIEDSVSFPKPLFPSVA